MSKRLKFSPSQMMEYKKCPFSWHEKYVGKRGWGESTIHIDFGNLVHVVLEYYQNHLHRNRKQRDFEYLRGLYDAKFHEIIADKYDEQEKYYEMGKTMINTAIQLKLLDPKTFVAAEGRFSLDHDGCIISAKYDRMERDGFDKIVLCDWKTGSKPSALEDLKEDFQYIVYSHFLQTQYEAYQKKECRWHFLSTGQTIVLEPMPADESGAMLDEKIHEMSSAETFETKTSPLCLWCAFFKDETCPEIENIKVKFSKKYKQLQQEGNYE